jgi:hypothetical protein
MRSSVYSVSVVCAEIHSDQLSEQGDLSNTACRPAAHRQSLQGGVEANLHVLIGQQDRLCTHNLKEYTTLCSWNMEGQSLALLSDITARLFRNSHTLRSFIKTCSPTLNLLTLLNYFTYSTLLNFTYFTYLLYLLTLLALLTLLNFTYLLYCTFFTYFT